MPDDLTSGGVDLNDYVTTEVVSVTPAPPPRLRWRQRLRTWWWVRKAKRAKEITVTFHYDDAALTMAQVKASGRFAWHEGSHCIFNPYDGKIYELEWWSLEEWQDDVGESAKGAGWRHFPGCGCEFCAP